MSTWPSTLPQCALISDWSAQYRDNVIKTDIMGGQTKRRLRFIYDPVIFPMKMILTKTQYQALIVFYNANPTTVFDWIDPITLLPAEVVFEERPQCTGRRGTLYVLGFAIEVQV